MQYKDISKDIRWNSKLCTYCNICIEFCPVKTLEFVHGEMKEQGKCIRCNLCEKYCPDLAIEVKDGKKTSSRK